jgi:hypothetical protein
MLDEQGSIKPREVTTMKAVLWGVTIAVLIALSAGLAMAQGQGAAAAKPGAILVDAATSTVTVDAIDAAKRLVTIKRADGATRTYKLGPEVKNFDQIKVGDQVKTTYVDSVAIFVRKSNEPPAAGQVETVEVAPKGAKPGIIVTDTTEITARVEAIDYPLRTLSLKGPQGNLAPYAVDDSVRNFNSIKAGDEVVVRVTEAVAITVEAP